MLFLEKLFSTSQIREIENHIYDVLKIDEYNLMFAAGESILDFILKKNLNKNQEIYVFCGSGNNGGDGFIVAALLKKNGFKVNVIEVGNFHNQSDIAKKAQEFALNNDVKLLPFHKDLEINDDSIIIDAIFGIGLKGEVKEDAKFAIQKINNSKSYVIAADISSGLCANSGNILGVSVQANATITFLGLKQGLFLNNGLQVSGKIILSNLGVEYGTFLAGLKSNYNILDKNKIENLIPQRKKDSHKGDFGHLLVVGGQLGMGGAVLMAAKAALKIGSGRVTILTKKENYGAIISHLPNVMVDFYENEEDLKRIIKDKDIIAIGPGLGKSDWAKELVEFFIKSDLPKIIDADALNLISEGNHIDLKNSIITPHPTEASRLLGLSTKEIQNNRVDSIKNLNNKYNCVSVLKGSGSLIFDNKNLVICPYGNPKMAVAGMGDVLTGIIAGFACQKLDLFSSAIIGVYVHGLAGDKTAEKNNCPSISPLDLIDNI
ncbi:MAG: NAD(P)H-hydrate epimerase [Rickettsiales bacterium]|jgi:NAD(P)H-hydrate epimerase